jgi:hypothetical protein
MARMMAVNFMVVMVEWWLGWRGRWREVRGGSKVEGAFD